MSVFQKLDYVAPQIGAGKSALQVGDDVAHPRCSIDAFQNLARAAGQLDHSFRIQEHVHLLRRLPLETVVMSDFKYRIVVQRHSINPVPNCGQNLEIDSSALPAGGARASPLEIGRAAWRGRGEISVGAGSI